MGFTVVVAPKKWNLKVSVYFRKLNQVSIKNPFLVPFKEKIA
jgi:hypothetical protein